MISRRNIRINVFQSIFETNLQNVKLNEDEALKDLNKKFNDTSALFAASFHLLILITEYVLIYSNQKASKHITTFEDKNVNTKIAGNIIIQQLKRNETFGDIIKLNKIQHLFEETFVKKLFLSIVNTPEYQKYISYEERNTTDEKAIIKFILDTAIFENEDTTGLLAEHYMNWYNDFEMIYSWTDKVLNNATKFQFNKIVSSEKLDFARDLLQCYYEKKEIVFALIEPKLVNWDAERVAVIDLILLHLGICELLYFESIPVKVTINEYIDLAKSYSNPQSGQFINGLLDNVRKELTADNKIHKQDYLKK